MQGKWIWYPGDFEIELASVFMSKRYERDVFIPVFWKECSCWKNVVFQKKANLDSDEEISVNVEGKFNIMLDGKYIYNFNGRLVIPAGRHDVRISVYNAQGLPTLKVDGNIFKSDNSWFVTCNDHVFKNACYNDALVTGASTPNCVKIPECTVNPINIYRKDGKTIYDFGKEIFARVYLKTLNREICIFYGESEDEALNQEECELISEKTFYKDGYVYTENPKAFRFISLSDKADKIIALSQNLPQRSDTYFMCSDDVINKIYQISRYTLSLNTREFIIDGIKRDRWIWSADAYLGYLMHYYSYFDLDSIRRTMLAVLGHKPVDIYLNHIMDYTFFAIIAFSDYYDFTGDRKFISDNFSTITSAMEFCISEANKNGLMEGKEYDWVFVDWADNLDNRGEVSFEQILFIAAVDKMSCLSREFGSEIQSRRYKSLHSDLIKKIEKFWDDKQEAYVHSYKDGVSDEKIYRYANILAIYFNICDKERQMKIVNSVLKNDNVQKITTPYMRFFELSALMQCGETQLVLEEMKKYWGGMINEGATTFWEAYNPSEKGEEKYAMYGRKFGKSLCHTWGASPIFLIGRYVVGLRPVKHGQEFRITPELSGLDYFKAKIPLALGTVEIYMDRKKIEVFSSDEKGAVVAGENEYDVKPGKKLTILLEEQNAVQYADV